MLVQSSFFLSCHRKLGGLREDKTSKFFPPSNPDADAISCKCDTFLRAVPTALLRTHLLLVPFSSLPTIVSGKERRKEEGRRQKLMMEGVQTSGGGRQQGRYCLEETFGVGRGGEEEEEEEEKSQEEEEEAGC